MSRSGQFCGNSPGIAVDITASATAIADLQEDRAGIRDFVHVYEQQDASGAKKARLDGFDHPNAAA